MRKARFSDWAAYAAASVALSALVAGCPGSDKPRTSSPDPRTLPPTGYTAEQQAAKVSQIVAAVKVRPAKQVDNSFCLVCHGNYKNESIVVKHAKKNIGCARCHGSSEKHSADEDGLTPPEILYPREAVNPACMTCHGAEKMAAETKHEKVLLNEPGGPICFDCHGKGHKLANRTRIWNPWTGKLVRDDGVRMGGAKK